MMGGCMKECGKQRRRVEGKQSRFISWDRISLEQSMTSALLMEKKLAKCRFIFALSPIKL